MRIYQPAASPTDPWQWHPLIHVDASRPDLALEQIAEHLQSAVTIPASLLRSLTPRPSPREVPPDRQASNALTKLTNELTDKTEQLRAKDAKITELRREVRTLAKQLRTAQQQTAQRTSAVYADPERQFLYEIEQHWLNTYPETDREERPLSEFQLGRDWLSSLAEVELASRGKIIEVVVEVLTGRVATSSARRARRIRTSPVGGSGTYIRDDGAVAWRCDIKQHTPSAPRLMWWRLSDGTIELGRVAKHDDVELR